MERFRSSETPPVLDAPLPSHNNHEAPDHDSPIRLALEQGVEHPVIVPVYWHPSVDLQTQNGAQEQTTRPAGGTNGRGGS